MADTSFKSYKGFVKNKEFWDKSHRHVMYY